MAAALDMHNAVYGVGISTNDFSLESRLCYKEHNFYGLYCVPNNPHNLTLFAVLSLIDPVKFSNDFLLLRCDGFLCLRIHPI